MGPLAVTEDGGIDIGPHPHMGLQTVTWLLAGEVLHRDSLGSEQLIRPGQLNLMTAGGGVSHAEERTGRYRGDLHGVQLWVALPEATRHGGAGFEHHAELPRLDLGTAEAAVLVGSLGSATSPARRDTDHVGASLELRPGRTVVPVKAIHEHALVVLHGAVEVDRTVVTPGNLAYLGAGRDELAVGARDRAAVLLIGGEPFESPVLMWWNFVARTRDEIDQAQRDWMEPSGRFGDVASALERIPVGPPPWRASG
jgi:redox-sensitive bicupin YhaK (pirin superfamily)